MTKTLTAALALGFVLSLMAGPALASTVTISDPTITFQAGNPVVDITEKDGVGALFLSTPDGNDKAQVAVTDADSKLLGELTSLSYRALREDGPAGVPQQLASINITLEPWAGTFVYEPVYDDSAVVVEGDWQAWDAFGADARWWNSNDSNTFLSWDDIIADHQDDQVAAIMVNQGSGNGGLQSYVDWVEVDGTTFDFAPAPRDKDSCKNGGWGDLGFQNQGRCIQYMNTGEDSR